MLKISRKFGIVCFSGGVFLYGRPDVGSQKCQECTSNVETTDDYVLCKFPVKKETILNGLNSSVEELKLKIEAQKLEIQKMTYCVVEVEGE